MIETPAPQTVDRERALPALQVYRERFRAVALESPSALDVLALAAFLSPRAVSARIVFAGRKALPRRLSSVASEAEMEGLFQTLARHQLADPQDEAVCVRDEVRRVARGLMSPADRHEWSQIAQKFLLELLTRQGEKLESMAEFDDLVDHVYTAINHCESQRVGLSDSGTVLNSLGIHLHDRNKAELARRCYNRSIAIGQKVHGAKDPILAVRWNNLGVVQRELGDFDKAAECFRNALQILRSTHRKSHESQVEPARNLLNVLFAKGDFDAARSACGEAMKLYLDLYVFHHPYVAECTDILAQIWRSKGELERALDCSAKAVLSAKSARDPDLESLALYQTNYGIVLLECNEPKKAEEQLRSALAHRESLGTSPEKSRGKILYHLLRALMDQNNTAEAGRLFAQAWRLIEASKTEDSPEAARLLRRGLKLYETMGASKAAAACLERLAAHSRNKYGEGSKNHVQELFHWAKALDKAEDSARALTILASIVSFNTGNGTGGETSAGDALMAAGRIYRKQEDHQHAREHFERACLLYRKTYGEMSVEVAKATYHVGCAMIALDEELVGHGHLGHALHIYETLEDEENPTAREIRKRLGIKR